MCLNNSFFKEVKRNIPTRAQNAFGVDIMQVLCTV